MGKMITEIVAEDEDVQIAAGVDMFGEADSGYPVYREIGQCSEEADAIIDFSSANGIEERIDYAVDRQIPLVECSTGLSQEQTEGLLAAGRKWRYCVLPICLWV